LERDWVARPGTLIYEPPGDIHTLVVDEESGYMITLFVLEGSVQYMDDDDNLLYQDDVFSKMERYLTFCREQGIEPRTYATDGATSMAILDDFKLDGRVALVTGAARGLGQGLALGLAEAGADVAALDILPLDETHEGISARGRRCHALNFDLLGTNSKQARKIVGDCVEALGRLDILVNNAGIIRRSPALEFGEEDWEDVIKINLTSAFFISQAAARHFVGEGRGGKIVNTASVLSYEGGITVPSYAAAKAGIANLTRALANEWAPLGINVNAIAPSYFTTELTSALRGDDARSEALLARIPAGRYGEPEDLKGAVVFLASDAADYVHGAILPVDGGWLGR
jgi:2-deoxy-D-gluconate 3-dehydrogenase